MRQLNLFFESGEAAARETMKDGVLTSSSSLRKPPAFPSVSCLTPRRELLRWRASVSSLASASSWCVRLPRGVGEEGRRATGQWMRESTERHSGAAVKYPLPHRPHLRLFRRPLKLPSLSSILILVFLVLFADDGQMGRIGTVVSDRAKSSAVLVSPTYVPFRWSLALCRSVRDIFKLRGGAPCGGSSVRFGAL